jgi:uncharacterized protein YdcH (DUF465 family)
VNVGWQNDVIIPMRIPHELQDEFPGEALFIARLIKSNYESGQLAARYDEVNRQIHRIESEEEPTAEEALEGLKKHSASSSDIATQLRKPSLEMGV